MFWAAHKQWKVDILILFNTSAPIKFRIVEMETDQISTSAPAGTRSLTLSCPRQTHEPLDYATFSLFINIQNETFEKFAMGFMKKYELSWNNKTVKKSLKKVQNRTGFNSSLYRTS